MAWSQCPFCGSQIAPHSSQCPVCGNSLIGEELPVYGDEGPKAHAQAEPYVPAGSGWSASSPQIYAPSPYNTVAFLLLGLFTGGLYSLYVISCMARDINRACVGDGQHTAGAIEFLLLSLITFGIYGIYWQYCAVERVRAALPRFGFLPSAKGIHIVMWNTLGLLLLFFGPVISWFITIDAVNALNGALCYRLSQPR